MIISKSTQKFKQVFVSNFSCKVKHNVEHSLKPTKSFFVLNNSLLDHTREKFNSVF